MAKTVPHKKDNNHTRKEVSHCLQQVANSIRNRLRQCLHRKMGPIFHPDGCPQKCSKYDRVVCKFLEPGKCKGDCISHHCLYKGKKGYTKERKGHNAFFKCIQFFYKIIHAYHIAATREGLRERASPFPVYYLDFEYDAIFFRKKSNQALPNTFLYLS